jgi:uncharacterized protein (UPF0332 family)
LNERNCKLNAADELDRARKGLTAARLSAGAGAFEEAVSSAYYAAHHAARALLFSLGLEVRSHTALRTLLSEHFVRVGVIPRDTSRRLAEFFDARHKADYGVRTRFSQEQAEAWVLWSSTFVEAAAAHLAPLLTPAEPPDGGPSEVREPRVPYRRAKPKKTHDARLTTHDFPASPSLPSPRRRRKAPR